jgi:high-affinity iron transporter
MRALLFCAVVLAGCGASDVAPPRPAISGPPVAPGSEGAAATPGRVAGTDLSADAVAAAASGRVTAAGPVPELQPLAPREFRTPVARYRAYSVARAAAMGERTTVLERALRRGDRPAARAAWLRAYREYLLVGAAYGALGDLDAAIVARLHAIEHGLWTGEPLAGLRTPAARLRADVARMRPKLARMRITPLDYATRAHEILEDAQRDQLSDAVTPWSGAGVHATAAALDATEVVIGTLRPLLAGRGALPPVESGLHGLRRELAAIRRAHGGRLPSTHELGRRERERLSGRLGAALEQLAGVPGALETALPPAIPAIGR